MKFLVILVTSGLINFQQPVENNSLTQYVDNKQLTSLAIDYLKSRYNDADFIQAASEIPFDGSHHRVYLVFSSEKTTIDHCIIHINGNHSTPKIEHILCMDYNTKLGYRENINPLVRQ